MALTKTGLSELLAEKTGSTKAIAAENLNAVLDIIQDELMTEDGKVTLPGFGTFSVTARPEREGRNPSTGQPMTISASNAVKFKVGKVLKDAVNV